MADATTYTGPTPGSGSYGLLSAQATQAYNDAMNQIKNQRNQYLASSGLVGEYDSSGNYTGYHVDANNPFGGFQQTLAGLAGQGAADQAALGAQGFGGGIHAHAQELLQQGYSTQASNWANQNIGNLANFGSQEQSATSQYGNTLYTDLLNDVESAIQNGTFNPANYAGITIPGYGDIGTMLGGLQVPGQNLGGGTGGTTDGGITAPTGGAGNGGHHGGRRNGRNGGKKNPLGGNH